MYEYIKGKIIEKNPSYIVIDANGIGYFVSISLNTYSVVEENQIMLIYVHQIVREDAHQLYGFATKLEREIFRLLISVSGIGANTARLMLSSLTPSEIQKAVSTENVNVLKGVKGIGIKTAQRTIIELKDKMIKVETSGEVPVTKSNIVKEEALSALIMLGFAKNVAEKAIDKILSENSEIKVEDLVKKSLKYF